MSIGMKMTFAAMFIAATTACGQSSPTMPSPTTVNATITAGAFAPNPINITVGSTVVWTNKDSAAHSVVADNGAFASSSIASGSAYTYVFPSAGTFNYHDGANAAMTGTVVVTADSSGGATHY